MLKILVPVDGSHNSNLVIPHVINEYQKNHCLEIHLLNVQPRFSAYIARFVNNHDLDDYRRVQAKKSLHAISQALDGFKVPYFLHVAVGNKAEVIAKMARELGCDHIVMSTARKNSLTRMLEDSVTNKVLELTTVPVELIAGDAVSKIERYGIHAALASAMGLVFLAAAD
jgi:nucleotide-binding universal stress UspA family protein